MSGVWTRRWSGLGMLLVVAGCGREVATSVEPAPPVGFEEQAAPREEPLQADTRRPAVDRRGDRARFSRSCNAGSVALANLRRAAGAEDEARGIIEDALLAKEEGCHEGLGLDCVEAARLYGDGALAVFDPELAKARLRRAAPLLAQGCAKDPLVCEKAGYLFRDGDPFAKDTRVARSYLERACKGGRQTACDAAHRLE